MIRRPPRSTRKESSAASDVYKRQRNAFADLREHLIPLTTNPYEKRAFVYFDIISWLESKIQSRPVKEVIREKALKRIASANAKGM